MVWEHGRCATFNRFQSLQPLDQSTSTSSRRTDNASPCQIPVNHPFLADFMLCTTVGLVFQMRYMNSQVQRKNMINRWSLFDLTVSNKPLSPITSEEHCQKPHNDFLGGSRPTISADHRNHTEFLHRPHPVNPAKKKNCTIQNRIIASSCKFAAMVDARDRFCLCIAGQERLVTQILIRKFDLRSIQLQCPAMSTGCSD